MTNLDITTCYVGDSQVEKIYLGPDIVWQKQSPVPPDLPYSAQPFTIQVVDTTDGNEINFFKIVPTASSQTAATRAPDKTLYYTINKPFTDMSTWTYDDNPWKTDGQYVVHVLHSNESITGLSSGDTVRFYTFVGITTNSDYPDLGGSAFGASGTTSTAAPNNVPTNSFGHSTVGCIVYGNIMSLITAEWFEYCYGEFSPITPITQFQQLSWASRTGDSTSRNIFLGLFCTSGTSAANKMNLYDAQNLVLPQDVTPGCYFRLFGRTEITNSPELPATTLVPNCYGYMYAGCHNLTEAPSLSADTLAAGCYAGMFYGCTSLTTAPALPATVVHAACYQSMFQGCTSLTTAPELPATSLDNTCYSSMFNSCRSLTTAPELPATTLRPACYQSMFQGCTSLTTAPELPATTLQTNCYASMFQGCSNMTGAPFLPATTLVGTCYSRMFYGCSHISEITCLATNPTSAACQTWLQNTSLTGTFRKASGVTWPSGTSGIPTGWTTEDYVEPAAENTGQ